MIGRRRRIGLRTAAILTLGLLLAGCADGSDSAGDAGGADMDAAVSEPLAPDAAREADDGAAVQEESGDGAASSASAVQQRVIRTASLEVEVDDVVGAAVRVRSVTTALGGYVASEDSSLDREDDEGNAERVANLTLRVPEARLDDALARVSELGDVTRRNTSDQVVTDQIADLDSRVASAEASVSRIRALMSEATTLKDVVLLEGELSRREADLEALQARLATLSDQADLATATVLLTEPATPPSEPEDEGLLGDLRASLRALGDTAMVLVTLLIVLLPWLVVVGAVGAVVLAVMRRRPRRAPTAPAPQESVGPYATVGAGAPGGAPAPSGASAPRGPAEGG